MFIPWLNKHLVAGLLLAGNISTDGVNEKNLLIIAT